MILKSEKETKMIIRRPTRPIKVDTKATIDFLPTCAGMKLPWPIGTAPMAQTPRPTLMETLFEEYCHTASALKVYEEDLYHSLVHLKEQQADPTMVEEAWCEEILPEDIAELRSTRDETAAALQAVERRMQVYVSP